MREFFQYVIIIIANNGKLVKPHIVKKIVDVNKDELIYESSIEKSNQ